MDIEICRDQFSDIEVVLERIAVALERIAAMLATSAVKDSATSKEMGVRA